MANKTSFDELVRQWVDIILSGDDQERRQATEELSGYVTMAKPFRTLEFLGEELDKERLTRGCLDER